MALFRRSARSLRRSSHPAGSAVRRELPRHRTFESLEDRRVMAVDVLSSTFSPSLMGDNIEELSTGAAVGFGYAINHQGNVHAAVGSDGQARTANNAPARNFTSLVELEVSSVSKTITATAILHHLQSMPGGLDAALKTKLVDYLPSDWDPGANIQHITLRHLLTHASGFSETNNAVGVNFEIYGNNTFANLQDLVEAGLPAPNVATDDVYDGPRWNLGDNYNNANFTLLARVVLPKLQAPALNLTAPAFPGGQRDSLSGVFYRGYVQNEIFEPLGILGADLEGNDANPARGYSLATANVASGAAMSNLTNLGGAFGWKLSARELATFLDGIERDNGILWASTRQMRDAQRLGWFQSEDAFGEFFGHNGATSSGSGNFRSQIASMPGGVEVAYLMNSESSNLPGGSIGTMLKTAYVNAWTDLTVAGSVDNDVFNVSVVTDTGKSAIQVTLNGELQFTRWIESLDSITLNGSLGNDTFNVNSWNPSVELTINGHSGADVVNLMPGTRNIELASGITFNGGVGNDTMLVNDQNNPYSMPGLSRQYVIGNDAVSRYRGISIPNVPLITYPVTVNYAGVENLEVVTGNQADVVKVASITSGVTEVRTGAGDDTILVGDVAGNLELFDGLLVDGQAGTDSIHLFDHNKSLGSDYTAHYDLHDDHVSRYTSGGFLFVLDPPAYQVHFAGIENLEATTTEGRDSIRVHSVVSGETVVNANDGDDALFTSPDGKNMELVRDLTFHGNAGKDRIVINDQLNPYSHASLSRQYTIGSGQAARSMQGSFFPLQVDVSYSGVEDVTLATGGQNDVVNVTQTTSGEMKIQTGAGDDVVNASSAAENLDTVKDLIVDGGAGVDTLNLLDANNPYDFGSNGGVYTIKPDSVRRLDAHPIWAGFAVPVEVGFANVEHVDLEAGALGDEFHVTGENGPLSLTLDGDSGADQFRIDGPAYDTIVVRGDAPIFAPGDTLSVNESGLHAAESLPGLYMAGQGSVALGASQINYSGIETAGIQEQIYGGPGDFDLSGVVDGEDLTHGDLGWNGRFGADLSGFDFLAWQRNFGISRLPEAEPPVRERTLVLSGGADEPWFVPSLAETTLTTGGGDAEDALLEQQVAAALPATSSTAAKVDVRTGQSAEDAPEATSVASSRPAATEYDVLDSAFAAWGSTFGTVA